MAKRDRDPEFDRHHTRLRTLITGAELALDRIRYRAPRRLDERGLPESSQERDQRILIEYEGQHYVDAACREGVNIPHIRALRKKYGRHPTDGRVLTEEVAA